MGKRKLVKEIIEQDMHYDIDGETLEKVVEYFQDKIKVYKKDYERCFLDIGSEESYGDISIIISILGERYETDKEFSERKKREKGEKIKKEVVEKKQKEEEYKEYLRLKEKYKEKGDII